MKKKGEKLSQFNSVHRIRYNKNGASPLLQTKKPKHKQAQGAAEEDAEAERKEIDTRTNLVDAAVP
jgi:hypothetical protein